MLSIITHTKNTVSALIGLNVAVLCASSKHSPVTPILRQKTTADLCGSVCVCVCAGEEERQLLHGQGLFLSLGSRPSTRSPHFHVSPLRDGKQTRMRAQATAALHLAVF